MYKLQGNAAQANKLISIQSQNVMSLVNQIAALNLTNAKVVKAVLAKKGWNAVLGRGCERQSILVPEAKGKSKLRRLTRVPPMLEGSFRAYQMLTAMLKIWAGGAKYIATIPDFPELKRDELRNLPIPTLAHVEFVIGEIDKVLNAKRLSVQQDRHQRLNGLQRRFKIANTFSEAFISVNAVPQGDALASDDVGLLMAKILKYQLQEIPPTLKCVMIAGIFIDHTSTGVDAAEGRSHGREVSSSKVLDVMATNAECTERFDNLIGQRCDTGKYDHGHREAAILSKEPEGVSRYEAINFSAYQNQTDLTVCLLDRQKWFDRVVCDIVFHLHREVLWKKFPCLMFSTKCVLDRELELGPIPPDDRSADQLIPEFGEPNDFVEEASDFMQKAFARAPASHNQACLGCGYEYHDEDARYCKRCGRATPPRGEKATKTFERIALTPLSILDRLTAVQTIAAPLAVTGAEQTPPSLDVQNRY